MTDTIDTNFKLEGVSDAVVAIDAFKLMGVPPEWRTKQAMDTAEALMQEIDLNGEAILQIDGRRIRITNDENGFPKVEELF